jgi:hypothetical protein
MLWSMTRRNPERPPGPSYYRLPEASWTMIRDEYLSGWTAKEIAAKWRVSPTSVYRHACNNGWTKAERGQAFHDQIVAEAEDRAAAPKAPPEPAGETWTSWKETPPESLREGPRPLPGLWHYPKRVWSPPPGYGPMPPHLVPPPPAPPASAPEDEADPPAAAPTAAEAAEQAIAAAARAVAAGRYEEAERLGRLAATLQKLAGGVGRAGARGDALVDSVEDEGDEAASAPGDRPLNCTASTCAMKRATAELEARLDALYDDIDGPEGDDLEDWTLMAEGIGAKADPEVMQLGAAYRAEGLNAVRAAMHDVLGKSEPGAPVPPLDLYRR